MQNSRFILLLILIAGNMLFLGACRKEEMQPDSLLREKSTNEEMSASAKPVMKQKKVMLAYQTSVGNYLTDENGRTLYISTRDIAGNSTCVTRCTGAWPAFNIKNPKVSEGLDARDFATITRPDGKQQATYKGWPLYYFSGDTQAGEVNGEGVDDIWFVAKPDYTVMLADQNLEAFEGSMTRYLTDPQGRTLYFFLPDPANGSICYDECIASWPVFTGSENIVIPSSSSLAANRFSVITRNDGKKQLAYLGMPLYYFSQDLKRGEAKGQLVENWTVAHLNWL